MNGPLPHRAEPPGVGPRNAEASLPPPCTSYRPAVVAALLAMFIALAVMTPRWQRPYLRHWDEAWYAQMSREVLRQPDPITVHWNGGPYFHKPPLALWATAGLFHLGGESVWTARAVSILSMVLAIGLLTFWMARELNPWSAVSTAMLLLAIPDFVEYSGRGQLDAPLLLLLTGRWMLFFYRDESKVFWLTGGVLLGLALMTKGTAALLGPIVEVGYLLAMGQWRTLGSARYLASLGVGVALALPWHVHQGWVHGEAFWKVYGGQHLLQAIWNIYPERPADSPPALYYFAMLLDKEKPFGWMVLAILATGVLSLLYGRTPRRVFLVTWSLLPLVVLSLAETKWRWYILPIYPGVCFLAADLGVAWVRRFPRQITLAAALVLLASTFEANATFRYREGEPQIAELAARVQAVVPPGTRMITLQTANGRKSVYPICLVYSCDRPVMVANSVEHFRDLALSADGAFYAFLQRHYWEEVRAAGELPRSRSLSDHSGALASNSSADNQPPPSFRIEVIAEAEPILFCRVVPGGRVEPFAMDPTNPTKQTEQTNAMDKPSANFERLQQALKE